MKQHRLRTAIITALLHQSLLQVSCWAASSPIIPPPQKAIAGTASHIHQDTQRDRSLAQYHWLPQKLRGTDDRSQFGDSVAVSGDGETIAIHESNPAQSSGSVHLYTKVDGEWTKKGLPIDAESAKAPHARKVALNQDGSIAALVAPTSDDGHGRVQVWTYDGDSNTWYQLGSDIVGSLLPVDETSSGLGVSLSDDGTRLAVSDDSKHAVLVFDWDSDKDDWVQAGEEIPAKGASASLAGDGATLAVGADDQCAGTSHVRVYVQEWGIWTPLGNIIEERAVGEGLTLSGDGKSLAAGSDDGTVRVYRLVDSTWSQVGGDIVDVGMTARRISLSLSEDGKKIAIGSPGDMSGDEGGTVKVFSLYEESAWVSMGERLEGSGSFGFSVALDKGGDILLSGNPFVSTPKKESISNSLHCDDDTNSSVLNFVDDNPPFEISTPPTAPPNDFQASKVPINFNASMAPIDVTASKVPKDIKPSKVPKGLKIKASKATKTLKTSNAFKVTKASKVDKSTIASKSPATTKTSKSVKTKARKTPKTIKSVKGSKAPKASKAPEVSKSPKSNEILTPEAPKATKATTAPKSPKIITSKSKKSPKTAKFTQGSMAPTMPPNMTQVLKSVKITVPPKSNKTPKASSPTGSIATSTTKSPKTSTKTAKSKKVLKTVAPKHKPTTKAQKIPKSTKSTKNTKDMKSPKVRHLEAHSGIVEDEGNRIGMLQEDVQTSSVTVYKLVLNPIIPITTTFIPVSVPATTATPTTMNPTTSNPTTNYPTSASPTAYPTSKTPTSTPTTKPTTDQPTTIAPKTKSPTSLPTGTATTTATTTSPTSPPQERISYPTEQNNYDNVEEVEEDSTTTMKSIPPKKKEDIKSASSSSLKVVLAVVVVSLVIVVGVFSKKQENWYARSNASSYRDNIDGSSSSESSSQYEEISNSGENGVGGGNDQKMSNQTKLQQVLIGITGKGSGRGDGGGVAEEIHEEWVGTMPTELSWFKNCPSSSSTSRTLYTGGDGIDDGWVGIMPTELSSLQKDASSLDPTPTCTK